MPRVLWVGNIKAFDDLNQRLKGPELTKLTEEATGLIANKAVQRIRSYLSRSNKLSGANAPVGATEEAAQNVSAEKVSSGAGSKWEVVEGTGTKANFFIRRGYNASRNKRGHAPFAAIRKWVASKPGFTLKNDPSNEKEVGAGFVKVTRRDTGRSYFRARRGQKEKANKALWAITKWISMMGSDYQSQNWFGLHPKGQGKFDYVGYLFMDSSFERALWDVSNSTVEAYINWLATGRKSGGTRKMSMFGFGDLAG